MPRTVQQLQLGQLLCIGYDRLHHHYSVMPILLYKKFESLYLLTTYRLCNCHKGQIMIYATLHEQNWRLTNTNRTKTGGELSSSEKMSSSCYLSDTRRVTVKTKIIWYINVLSKPYTIQSNSKENKHRNIWRYQRGIRSRKLKKDRPYNDQKKNTSANNDLQNIK